MAEDGSRLSALGSRPSPIGAHHSVGDLIEELARRLTENRTPRTGRREPEAESREPRAEGRELLAALLDVPRHWPLLRANKWVEPGVWQRACAAADKRASGAPLAYAVGRANFRDLTLDVDERVLIPRPETELLVDLVLQRKPRGSRAIDVGTGSGAIAIALATEGQFGQVIATDISQDALDVACVNAARSGASVEFLLGDLLEASDVGRLTFDVIVSNPPYISFEEIRQLPRSVRDWEPSVALLSGRGGLAVTTRLIGQAGACLAAGGLLALEVDVRRAALVAEQVASDARFDEVIVKLDLAGRERFVLATRREGVHA